MKNWAEKPSSSSFDGALHKGFGRVYIWAKAGFATAPQLIDACLNDFRYDSQCEDARGDWLWRVAQASSIANKIKQPVLDALDDIANSNAEVQLCQLARHFAKEDERFKARLRRIVEEKPAEDMPWLGEKELIRLDGVEGFLMALRRHGADLTIRPWDWFDVALVDSAKEILGAQPVSEIVAKVSATDEDAGRFVEVQSQVQLQKSNDREQTYRERISELTVDGIIAAAESREKTSALFRGWGGTQTSPIWNACWNECLNAIIPKQFKGICRSLPSDLCHALTSGSLSFASTRTCKSVAGLRAR